MLFEDMYAKPIDRPIDPVVKPDSVSHLANELDEYVVTSELEGHLLRFFEEYNDVDTTGNGAWISGYFGSGKSHLLKILAMMLEDKEVDGKKSFDYILPKIQRNPALKGAMEVARVKHPSESILFDIGVAAPNQGRSEANPILAAFIKVFNAHCGYYDGDQQHIAELEYDLDKAAKLETFTGLIEEMTGKPWVQVRSQALLNAAKITKAFDQVSGNPDGYTRNVIQYYRDTYMPSVDSFSKRVKEYIDKHEAGFRLNFFVDEIGLYVAGNPELMVKVQDIAVALNTACGGDSWILVTSQENVEDVLGEMKKKSANDFSKIQARFEVKILLTSKDAKTVIKERLLKKGAGAVPEIESMYARYKDDFRVLFDFADGSKHYKNYADKQDFVDTYPFVPYQFDLFITAMRRLSDFNAFTGRHHSTGARSMLGVFQGVGASLVSNGGNGLPGSTEDRTLATFDSMFEGLRNSLKGEVYGQISIAENNLADNPMAIRVLKALLLVKYCDDFKATAGNIRVLLYGSFAQNTSQLEQEIKDALAELERQVYVRRSANSNVYEYLTDEEKDIEKEIRNTEVTVSEIENCIAEMLKDIVGSHRATYRNGSFEHSFNYNLRIDGDNQGQQRHDLTVNIITDPAVSNGSLGVIPTAPKTLSVALKDANEYLNNVRIYMQTQKYANLNSGSGEVRAAIVSDKRKDAAALHQKLRQDFTDLLTNALYNAGGVDVTGQLSGSGKDILAAGVQELIRRSYTGLQQLSKHITDNDVYQNCLAGQLFANAACEEYVETVFSRIGLLSSAGVITIGGDGISSLIAYFSKNEFGWPDVAVRNALALLYRNRRIEIRKSGTLVEDTALADALKTNIDMGKYSVSKTATVSADQLASINQAYRRVTGVNPSDSDAKAIGADLVTYLSNQIAPIEAAASQASSYPFSQQYRESLVFLKGIITNATNDNKWVIEQFPQKADEAARTLKDLSSMKQFVDGSPIATKWQEISAFKDHGLQEAKELHCSTLTEELIGSIDSALADPECYKSNVIPAIASDIKRIADEATKVKANLRKDVEKRLDEYQESFEQNYSFDELEETATQEFQALFEHAKQGLSNTHAFYQLTAFFDNFRNSNAARLIELVTPRPKVPGVDLRTSEEENGGKETPPSTQPAVVTIPMSHCRATAYSKPAIESEQDVDDYLTALRADLMKEIGSGHIVMK